jgi:hypothetical protein
MLLSACAATYAPQPVAVEDAPGDILSVSQRDVTVSTTILGDAQAERLYGVDLGGAGLQAIWLKIDNRSSRAQWLLVSALDPNYYPPGEATAQFRAGFGAEEERAIAQRFDELALPLKTPAGEVNEGYVIAPRHEGGRYVVVKLLSGEGILDFGFPVTMPDGEFDFEQLHPDRVYGGRALPEFDLAQFREELRGLPCCVSDEGGERMGDPLNLVLVGEPADLLAAVARAGWTFTRRITIESVKRMIGATLSGAAYPVAPVSPLYLLGRQQDVALQRPRSTIVQRNHLRLWLAPFRFEGRSVWIGQVSRDVAVKATTKSSTLTTHVIDPNVDEAREHLLQSLIVAGAVDRFAFVQGMPPALSDAPRSNLTDDPYFTDGLRVVVILAKERIVPPEDAEFIEWRNSADPIRHASGAGPPAEDTDP